MTDDIRHGSLRAGGAVAQRVTALDPSIPSFEFRMGSGFELEAT